MSDACETEFCSFMVITAISEKSVHKVLAVKEGEM